MFRFKKIEKWPSTRQWANLFKILTLREKIFFLSLFFIFCAALIFISIFFYEDNTRTIPTIGGTYVEGILGQPRFINPIFANSDADRDISQLVYSGLMKYDENMGIIPDLAQSFEVSEDGKTYKFYLKENLTWEDKSPITADDIIFTVKTIQNPDYKSPFRANWVGVDIEKLNDLSVKFILKKPYSSFLENCTLKIMPQHIWREITPENFAFDSHNLKPVGSGPYKIKELKQEKDETFSYLSLKPNSLYYGKNPYISEIKFNFFGSESDLIKAARQKRIDGFSLSAGQNTDKRWRVYNLSLPRYFAVFFNEEKSKVLSDENIRAALNYATDKNEVAKKALGLNSSNAGAVSGAIANSPILPEIYGLAEPKINYNFDQQKAKDILSKAGYKDENNDNVLEKTTSKKSAFQLKSDLKLNSQGTEVEELQKCLAKFSDIYPNGEVTGKFGKKTEEAVIKFQEKYKDEILKPAGLDKGTGQVGKTTRTKLNQLCFANNTDVNTLKFTLITVDQPQMANVAEELKRQWKVIGVEIEIKKLPISQIEQDFIKPREYEMLLFGEVLSAFPDLYPFWHSSQIKDPGLNLSEYVNKDADKLMEDIRNSSDQSSRNEKLLSLQEIILGDAPADFLYSPDYVYFASKKADGINVKKIVDPSKRFTGIENWYVKTKRIWK